MHNWQGVVRDLAHRIQADVTAVLDGLDPSLLDTAGVAGTNTVGWLLWHLTRSHDRNISELRGLPQLWLSSGWHARFGRAPDPDDTGYRHTPDQVVAFRSPSAAVMLGYHRATVEAIDNYLDQAPADDLARRSTSPTLGDTVTVQRRLVGVLVEGLEHVGQAALLRGVLISS